jgi:hypothetical protein
MLTGLDGIHMYIFHASHSIFVLSQATLMSFQLQ